MHSSIHAPCKLCLRFFPFQTSENLVELNGNTSASYYFKVFVIVSGTAFITSFFDPLQAPLISMLGLLTIPYKPIHILALCLLFTIFLDHNPSYCNYESTLSFHLHKILQYLLSCRQPSRLVLTSPQCMYTLLYFLRTTMSFPPK